MEESVPKTVNEEVATFGGGCFWCTEAVFAALAGVKKVVPGYTGGTKDAPTYREVCTGNTGHAEVIQITFDPTLITYEQLLEVFFKTHDPTTPNRQGNDVGTQYRSSIFPQNLSQKEQAEKVIAALTAANAFGSPIVTSIEPASTFYPAEDYHHNYFAQHGNETYCQLVIRPKVEKFQKVFSELLK